MNSGQSANAKQEQTEEEIVNLATQHAEQLIEVLDSEYQAMHRRDLDSISELANQKDSLLKSLSSLEPKLVASLTKNIVSENSASFKKVLLLCRERNERNRTIALVELNQNTKALSLLKSVMKVDDESVYNAVGSLSGTRVKRYLGSV